VWRELWPVLGDEITALFARSLETGKMPLNAAYTLRRI
jgi:hypothetical protein